MNTIHDKANGTIRQTKPPRTNQKIFMQIDEKYFEEKALKLLDSFRGLENIEPMDWQKLRKSFVQWQIKHGGSCAIANTALAPLLDAGDIKGQADLIRKCKSAETQLYHSTISYLMAEAALKSNTGSSMEDAIYVASVSEEYKLLKEHLGCKKINSQALIEDNGKSFDLMEILKEDDSIQEYYFDVTDVMTLENLDCDYLSNNKEDDDIWSFLDKDNEEEPEQS